MRESEQGNWRYVWVHVKIIIQVLVLISAPILMVESIKWNSTSSERVTYICICAIWSKMRSTFSLNYFIDYISPHTITYRKFQDPSPMIRDSYLCSHVTKLSFRIPRFLWEGVEGNFGREFRSAKCECFPGCFGRLDLKGFSEYLEGRVVRVFQVNSHRLQIVNPA